MCIIVAAFAQGGSLTRTFLKMDHPIKNAVRKRLVAGLGKLYHRALVSHTHNFSDVRWLGYPTWQCVFDLWTIQETIADLKPALLIETGTNRAGSARFYAQLFDLMGTGQVVTVDVERQHSVTHPRITFLMGSSTDPAVVEQVKARATEAKGSVMVILDSDHSRAHVLRELVLYAPLVTLHSYCLVQDGIIDQLAVFRRGRPGPLRALEQFLRSHPDFVVDADKCQRFLVTHHPKGWLKRIAWRGAE